MAPFQNFIGPSYTVQSPNADCERLMNWYPSAMESPGAKAPLVYDSCPGLTAVVTLPDTPIRGLFAINGTLFIVAGAHIYSMNSAGQILGSYVDDSSLINNGVGTAGTAPASFSTDGSAFTQVVACYNGHAIVVPIDPGTFPARIQTIVADVIGYLDGYTLALNRATSTLQISDLEDPTTWDPTQVDQRTSAVDKWQTLLVVNGDIWLFGDQTSDVWYNAGTAPFPFQFKAQVQVGIASPYAAAICDNAPMWLAQSSSGRGTVVRAANGYGPPVRVSTQAVEAAIKRYATIADAVAWSYDDQGHSFFVLNFPTANATWVWDASTGLWHERGYWNRTTGQWNSYRPMNHAFAYGTHYVGDSLTGTIYALSTSVATDVDGQGIRRMRRCPHLVNEQDWIFYHQLQIDMEVGLGLSSGQGSDPQMMLRWSNDAAKSWSNEHWTTAGAIGGYKTRVLWNRLGRARDRVFEFSVSDPVPWRLAAAYLDFTPGRH